MKLHTEKQLPRLPRTTLIVMKPGVVVVVVVVVFFTDNKTNLG
jgi:hypothetical protein